MVTFTFVVNASYIAKRARKFGWELDGEEVITMLFAGACGFQTGRVSYINMYHRIRDMGKESMGLFDQLSSSCLYY